MTARVGFHLVVFVALLPSLGSISSGADESNPRIRRMGTELTLRSDATNEDLEQLKGEKGITSLTCLMGAISILYTFFGGIRSVVWNDCVQFLVYMNPAPTVTFGIGSTVARCSSTWFRWISTSAACTWEFCTSTPACVS